MYACASTLWYDSFPWVCSCARCEIAWAQDLVGFWSILEMEMMTDFSCGEKTVTGTQKTALFRVLAFWIPNAFRSHSFFRCINKRNYFDYELHVWNWLRFIIFELAGLICFLYKIFFKFQCVSEEPSTLIFKLEARKYCKCSEIISNFTIIIELL